MNERLCFRHALALLVTVCALMGAGGLVAEPDAAAPENAPAAVAERSNEGAVAEPVQQLSDVVFPTVPDFLKIETNLICIPGAECNDDWECGSNGCCHGGSTGCVCDD